MARSCLLVPPPELRQESRQATGQQALEARTAPERLTLAGNKVGNLGQDRHRQDPAEGREIRPRSERSVA
ncbi:MAG TPA: hypothetical protein VFF86_00270, partial [Candidatus Methylomirabilis sp.]|nr:hypothetical protein [Candidatus Methylomirabilis sp.]